MQEINPHLYPDGGYVFTNADGSVLRGENWHSLERRVRGYRALNKLDPGDPWREIVTQICAKHPAVCRDQAPGGMRGQHSLTFNQIVLNWLVSVIGLKRVNRLPRVDDATAARRAAICSTCPRQKGLNESCSSCMYSLKHSRSALLDGAISPHQNLMPCGVLGEDTATAVHFEQASTDARGLPENCWRRPPK